MTTRAFFGEHEVRPLRPLRVVEYDRLVELGLFEGERIELLQGVLVAGSAQSPRHAGLVRVTLCRAGDTVRLSSLPDVVIAVSDILG